MSPTIASGYVEFFEDVLCLDYSSTTTVYKYSFKGRTKIVKAYILSLIAYQMVKHNHRNPIHKLFIIFGTSVLVDKLCGAFIREGMF